MIIDIILPTYNRASFLSRAIESVLQQTYLHWKLMIVDDGSTDETQDILKKYVQLDTRIQSKKIEQSGVGNARNSGVLALDSQWISFLDSDDEWLPDKLQQQVSLAQKDQVVLIYSDENWIKDQRIIQKKSFQKKAGGQLFLKSLEQCLIGPSTVMLKRSVFEEVGGFLDSYPVCEDYDLWLKITSLYEVHYIDRPLINKYGGHQDQLSTTTKAMDYWRVLSIDWILKNRSLSNEQRSFAVNLLLKKASIQKNGFEKYGHSDKAKQMEHLIEKYCQK